MKRENEISNRTIESYRKEFEYYNLEYHIILYIEGMIFALNPDNFSIRPFNSILWHSLNKNDGFFAFREFIISAYNKLCSDSLQEFGEINGLSNWSINLSELILYIKANDDIYFLNNLYTKDNLLSDINILSKYLKEIYNKN